MVKFRKHLKQKSNFFIIFSDCDCQTVNVTSNKGVEGIYQKLGDVNGKTSWNSSAGVAVWFSPTYEGWFFGPMEYIGQNMAYIISFGTGNHSCFYNIPGDQWLYYDYGSSAWAYVNVGDVSIECLSGKSNRLIFCQSLHII